VRSVGASVVALWLQSLALGMSTNLTIQLPAEAQSQETAEAAERGPSVRCLADSGTEGRRCDSTFNAARPRHSLGAELRLVGRRPVGSAADSTADLLSPDLTRKDVGDGCLAARLSQPNSFPIISASPAGLTPCQLGARQWMLFSIFGTGLAAEFTKGLGWGFG
jgi:hypothetical protein